MHKVRHGRIDQIMKVGTGHICVVSCPERRKIGFSSFLSEVMVTTLVRVGIAIF